MTEQRTNADRDARREQRDTDFLRDLTIGDTVMRVMPGFQSGEYWEWDATVVELTEDTIICQFIVDQPRKGKYDRITGEGLAFRDHSDPEMRAENAWLEPYSEAQE